jgi:hypothetical protein
MECNQADGSSQKPYNTPTPTSEVSSTLTDSSRLSLYTPPSSRPSASSSERTPPMPLPESSSVVLNTSTLDPTSSFGSLNSLHRPDVLVSSLPSPPLAARSLLPPCSSTDSPPTSTRPKHPYSEHERSSCTSTTTPCTLDTTKLEISY